MAKFIWWLIVDGEPVEPIRVPEGEDPEVAAARITNIEPDQIVPTGLAKIEHPNPGPPICSWKWNGSEVVPRPEGEMDRWEGEIRQEARAKCRYRLPVGASPPPAGAPSKRLNGPGGADATVAEGEVIIAERLVTHLEYRAERAAADPFLPASAEQAFLERRDEVSAKLMAMKGRLPAGHPWKTERPQDPWRRGSGARS